LETWADGPIIITMALLEGEALAPITVMLMLHGQNLLLHHSLM
jgi:hypothetical protein